jgi:hypothetical protein
MIPLLLMSCFNLFYVVCLFFGIALSCLSAPLSSIIILFSIFQSLFVPLGVVFFNPFTSFEFCCRVVQVFKFISLRSISSFSRCFLIRFICINCWLGWIFKSIHARIFCLGSRDLNDSVIIDVMLLSFFLSLLVSWNYIVVFECSVAHSLFVLLGFVL